MSNVGGEQIVGVLSSHGKELCHVYELKGLTFSKPVIAWGKCLKGAELVQLNLNLYSRYKEKRDSWVVMVGIER